MTRKNTHEWMLVENSNKSVSYLSFQLTVLFSRLSCQLVVNIKRVDRSISTVCGNKYIEDFSVRGELCEAEFILSQKRYGQKHGQ
jgi:hypothetical protein